MYQFQPRDVCSQMIYFDLTDDDRVTNVSFLGGCNGNLKAIGKLVDGMEAEQVIDILKGNDCAGRGTSCADQFTKALELALQQRHETAPAKA
ncbi:MAG: TIGR03905 family TSCPD domain-containing protein [Eggerthellaceae bacterium]|jgi:uncharacterized protein (TIGR03905 family)